MELKKLSLESLKEIYNQIEKEILFKESEAKQKENDYVLKLKVAINGDLYIFYTKNIATCLLGWITKKGKCSILNDDVKIENYNDWRENGMKVSSTSVKCVKWRGGVYAINENFILERVDYIQGLIYCFNECFAKNKCSDENIIRFKHNNSPILF